MIRELPSDYPVKWLECRDRLHAWFDPPKGDPDHKIKAEPGTGLSIRTLLCIRCSTRRYDKLDEESGYKESSRYKHPKGYLIPRGPGIPMPRQSIRAMALRAARRASRVRKVA